MTTKVLLLHRLVIFMVTYNLKYKIHPANTVCWSPTALHLIVPSFQDLLVLPITNLCSIHTIPHAMHVDYSCNWIRVSDSSPITLHLVISCPVAEVLRCPKIFPVKNMAFSTKHPFIDILSITDPVFQTGPRTRGGILLYADWRFESNRYWLRAERCWNNRLCCTQYICIVKETTVDAIGALATPWPRVRFCSF